MRRWRTRWSVPLVGLASLLGLAITAGLVSLAVKGMVRDEDAAFGIEVGAVKDSLVQRLTSVDEMLHGMRLLLDASKSVDADAFQIVGNDALTTNALVKEVMYLPRITDDERDDFERAKHVEGYPSYRISNRHHGAYVPAGRQTQHFPIVFFEPFTPLTARRLGLDLLSEPETQPFVQRAIDTGVATAAIDAHAATADEYLVFQAIYADKPKPGLDVVAERRQLVSGVVAVKVDARRLLEMPRPLNPTLSVAVCAHPALSPGQCVGLASRTNAEARSTGQWIFARLQRDRDVAVGTQHFAVRFRQDLYWQDLALASLVFALLAGGVFTAMLVSLARSIRARAADLQRRNADIQQVVEARTHELGAAKERALVTLESIADGVVTSDANGIIDYLNPVAGRLSGWSEKDLVGRPIADLFKVLDETSGAEVENPALGCLRSGIPVLHHEKSLFVNRGGDVVAINESAAPIRGAQGQITGLVLVLHDVSKARRLTQQMSFQATHDALTGLPNRTRLTEYLQTSLAAATADGRTLAVMFLDLDRFKIVNDTLGHDAGDQLLCEVARRLKHCVREGDIVSRLGGDEFVVVTWSVGQRAAVQQLATRLLKAIQEPFCIGDSEFFTSASIGITLFPDHGSTCEALLKNADATMYRVKAQGKNNFGFYDERTDHREGERLGLETDMRHALERGQMVVHYQPQFSACDGAITGFEALVRWLHPVRGLMPPKDFLPLAEETGFIVDIGDWVMHEACRQNRAWQDAGLPKVTMAVNIAHKQFMRPLLVNDVRRVLETTCLAARYLELELTEGILAHNAADATKRLTELKRVGVKLSIDDFGTGYSSLSYLKRFPLDSVKIDRSFIKDLETDPRDAEISAAIIAMSHGLKLSVLAEGVETAGQLEFLRRKGCDTVQGFLFSPAVPADEAEAFLRGPVAGKPRAERSQARLRQPSTTTTAPLSH